MIQIVLERLFETRIILKYNDSWRAKASQSRKASATRQQRFSLMKFVEV